MPKLLCLDFDDTLLCSDKTVSEENQSVLRQVLEAGHYIAFTTGRPLRGAKKLFAKLSDGLVTYDHVDSYQELVNKVLQ